MMNAVEERGVKKDKLFNFRPAFFAAIFFAFGIVYGYYRKIYGISAWSLLTLIPIAAMPFFFCRSRKDVFYRMAALLLLTASFALGASALRSQLYSYTRCGYYNGVHTVTGTVTSYTKQGESFRLVLTDITVDGKEENGLLNAYLPTSYTQSVRIADEVALMGRVRTRTEYLTQNYFRANDINDGVRFLADNLSAYQKTGRSDNLFLRIRDRVERVVCGGMDETSASVTLGVLIGDTTKIEGDLLNNMRQGGIAHIFAVSGLHVGALYAFILLLFSKTALRRLSGIVQFLALAAVLLFYAGICGFSPSIVRAMTLCLVGYCMRRLGGASDGLEMLGLAAILILLFTPCALFEIGFQLSFAACLGIVLLAKRIGQVCNEGAKLFRKVFPRHYTEEEKRILEKGDTLPLSVGERIFRSVVSIFSASLAAQLFTAPLQYMAFGYLSAWSLLLNLFFVPLISGVFAVLLLLVFLACLLPLWCSYYVLYIPAVLLNAALLLFEVIDFSTFSLTSMQLSGESCVCYYGGIIFLTDKWNLSKKQRRLLALLFFVGFAVILATLNR